MAVSSRYLRPSRACQWLFGRQLTMESGTSSSPLIKSPSLTSGTMPNILKCVHHVSEHPSTMCPVHTPFGGRAGFKPSPTLGRMRQDGGPLFSLHHPRFLTPDAASGFGKTPPPGVSRETEGPAGHSSPFGGRAGFKPASTLGRMRQDGGPLFSLHHPQVPCLNAASGFGKSSCVRLLRSMGCGLAGAGEGIYHGLRRPG